MYVHYIIQHVPVYQPKITTVSETQVHKLTLAAKFFSKISFSSVHAAAIKIIGKVQTLDWTNGILDWFLHMLWFVKLIFTG